MIKLLIKSLLINLLNIKQIMIFLKNLKNSNEEIFEIAKKVKGWGRIYSVKYLKVTNDEIKEWILEEGCHNEIDPAYTALTCAKK